jgi:hypothetical protein
MKTRLPALLLPIVFAAAPLSADIARAPLFVENFNVQHARVEYRNGAKLGVPGTGVSGKPGDLAYIGVPSTSENERNGPAALAIAPIAPDAMDAFTCAFWYYLDEIGPELQVPLSTAGVLFLLNERGFEIRIEHSIEQPRQYVFAPGIHGPHLGWRDSNRWIFAAFSWDSATNTLVVHQGTPQAAVAFMREITRPAPGNPTLPRADLLRDPETIGNTSRIQDRPLAGRLDNLRFYDRVLDRAELEEIRRADLVNEPVPLK